MVLSCRGWCLSVASLLAVVPALAAPPHEHGVARLDVVVSNDRVSIDLESPLDNLLGFERAPRSDAERQKASAVVAQLRGGEALFRIDGGAGCSLLKAELNAAALQLGTAKPAAGEHADLDGHYDFRCKNGARAGFVEVGLFEAFPALRRIDLQVSTPKGQLKATLRKPATRVVLAR
jgi:hypothetical protein